MPYQPIAHGKLSGLDYCDDRPFIEWYRPDLLSGIDEWLQMDPPRLELATLAFDELRGRGTNRARRAEALFENNAIEPVEWLPEAHRLAIRELKPSTTPRRRARLYVILRDGYTARNSTYGAYVGVTSRPVEDRFLQHRTGIKAAKGLKRNGIELLYSLFDWTNPIPGTREAKLQRETELHKLLEQVIPRVSGDVVRPEG